MPDIRVDPEVCTACGACVALCTAQVYAELNGKTQAVAPEECWLCGHCVAACPADAIEHGGYPTKECIPPDRDALPSLEGLVTAFRARRSARVFDDRPVPRKMVRELVDIARWVPSGSNAQPVDWLAIDDAEQIARLGTATVAVLVQTARLLRNPLLRPILRLTHGAEQVEAGLASAEKFARLEERLAQGKDPIFRNAPVVLVAHVPKGDSFGRDHATYAAYNLMLAAERMGLGTCQIGYFQIALARSQQLREALELSKVRRAEVTLILGYPVYDFQRLLPRRQPELAWNLSREDRS